MPRFAMPKLWRFARLRRLGTFAAVLCLASLTASSGRTAGARVLSSKVGYVSRHKATSRKAKHGIPKRHKTKHVTRKRKKTKHKATHVAVKRQKSPAGAHKPSPTSATRAAGTSSDSVSSGTPILGTFGISSLSDMASWKAAGGNAIVVSVNWAAAQPSAHGPVALTTAGDNGGDVSTEIQDAHAVGLQVYLELDLQVPPAWVQSGVPEFVNQAGTAYLGGDLASGTVVRDWIWSEVGRQAVASFVSGALSDLAPVLPDVAGFRVGGGQTGELQYPDDGSTVNGEPSFWAYDTAAQTGVGIASDESPSPIKGYVYGSGTATQDATWAAWYLDSLAIWNKWFILQLRAAGWAGHIYVLHPSWGIRTSWTPSYEPYTLELSHGADPAVMMDYYKSIPDVYPWCTWADAAEPNWDASQSNDFNAAPWREILTLAQEDGMGGHVMGENAGGGGGGAIHQLMSGALASGLNGVFYLDYQSLVSQNLLGDLIDQFDTYR